MRTNRGPQKSWLFRIGKATDLACPCGHPSQDGDHITFDCGLFRKERKDPLGLRKSWEELEDPIGRKDEGDNSHWDTIEAIFDFVFCEFS